MSISTDPVLENVKNFQIMLFTINTTFKIKSFFSKSRKQTTTFSCQKSSALNVYYCTVYMYDQLLSKITNNKYKEN